MKTDENRQDTKIQARVSPDIKADLKTMADKQGLNLGAFVTRILTLYWTNKKRKGQC